MKVKVKGTTYSLTQHDFVAKGGQGSVYAKGSTAFKVYHKSSDMPPPTKVAELSKITDDRVIRPLDIVTTAKGEPIGYTMRFVGSADDIYSLCQLFPKAFKERNRLKPDKILDLVLMLREAVMHVHSCGVQIIDLNELNVLVEKSFSELFLIDADSYQTKSCRATYIMPSVRDWSVEPSEFGESSDWFSFAIVTFQMFIGIHPYKGKHPDVKKLEDRMRANISVLDKAVSVPKACYPLDVLPSAYRKWYESVFVNGEREIPPADAHAITPISVPLAISVVSRVLVISEIRSYPDTITQFFSKGGIAHVNGTGVFIGSLKRWEAPPTRSVIALSHSKKIPCLIDLEGKVIACPGRGLSGRTGISGLTDIMEYEGRAYAKFLDRLAEVRLADSGSEVLPIFNFTANTMRHAVAMHPGVLIENMLGSVFVSVFPLENMRYQIRMTELEEGKIVDAKYDRGVLVAIIAKNGKYDRLVFRFNSSYTEYDTRVVKDVSFSGVNFVTLASGVCVLLNEDEKLEVFSFKMGSKSVKIIEDAALGGDMRLVRLGEGLGFYRGNQLFSMKMK